MRIVAGTWAGRPLTSPGPRIRPTMEPLRIACMDMLGPHLAGARFLDCFAGTGAVGLEALSRGAGSCDFVEDGRAAAHGLKANVAAVRSRDRIHIFLRDAIPFVEGLQEGAYDIAFVDPPYGSRKLDRILARWKAVPFSPILVLEHAADHRLELPQDGCRIKTRQIDNSCLTLLRLRPQRQS